MTTIYIDPAIRPKNEDNPFLKRFKINALSNQRSHSKKIIILVATIINRRLYDFFLEDFKDIGITTKVSEFNIQPVPLILSYKKGIEKELEKLCFDELYIIDDLGELPHKLFSTTSPLNSKTVFYSTTDLAFETSVLNNFNTSKNTIFIHSDILLSNITSLRLSHLFSEDEQKKNFFRTLALYGTKDQFFISEHNYIASAKNKKLKCTSIQENFSAVELTVKDIKIKDCIRKNEFVEEQKSDNTVGCLTRNEEIKKGSLSFDELLNNKLKPIHGNLIQITDNIEQLLTIFVNLSNKVELLYSNMSETRVVKTDDNELEMFDQLAAFRSNKTPSIETVSHIENKETYIHNDDF